MQNVFLGSCTYFKRSAQLKKIKMEKRSTLMHIYVFEIWFWTLCSLEEISNIVLKLSINKSLMPKIKSLLKIWSITSLKHAWCMKFVMMKNCVMLFLPENFNREILTYSPDFFALFYCVCPHILTGGGCESLIRRTEGRAPLTQFFFGKILVQTFFCLRLDQNEFQKILGIIFS